MSTQLSITAVCKRKAEYPSIWLESHSGRCMRTKSRGILLRVSHICVASLQIFLLKAVEVISPRIDRQHQTDKPEERGIQREESGSSEQSCLGGRARARGIYFPVKLAAVKTFQNRRPQKQSFSHEENDNRQDSEGQKACTLEKRTDWNPLTLVREHDGHQPLASRDEKKCNRNTTKPNRWIRGIHARHCCISSTCSQSAHAYRCWLLILSADSQNESNKSWARNQQRRPPYLSQRHLFWL